MDMISGLRYAAQRKLEEEERERAEGAGESPDGATMWQEVMGVPAPDGGGDFVAMTRDHVFGQVWSRGGLSRRERRLVTLTAIAAGGAHSILPFHLGAALESGDLSSDDLDELAIHLAHYAGWPVGAVVHTAVRQAVQPEQPPAT